VPAKRRFSDVAKQPVLGTRPIVVSPARGPKRSSVFRAVPILATRDLRVPQPILDQLEHVVRLRSGDLLRAFATQFAGPMREIEERGRPAPDTPEFEEARKKTEECTGLLYELYEGLIEQACNITGWNQAVITEKVKAFMDFEPLLYDSSAKYRDHLVHALTVCLLGLLVLDHFLDEIAAAYNDLTGLAKRDRATVEAVWILTSLTHDVGYGVERLQEMLLYHVREITGLYGTGAIDFAALLGTDREADADAVLERIASHVAAPRLQDNPSSVVADVADKGKVLAGLRTAFSAGCDGASKPHGVHAAVGLLVASDDFARRWGPPRRSHVLNAAVAIALHHFSAEQLDECFGHHGLRMSEHPMAALLLFCDLASESHRARIMPPDHAWAVTDIPAQMASLEFADASVTVRTKMPGKNLDKAEEAGRAIRRVVADMPIQLRAVSLDYNALLSAVSAELRTP